LSYTVNLSCYIIPNAGSTGCVKQKPYHPLFLKPINFLNHPLVQEFIDLVLLTETLLLITFLMLFGVQLTYPKEES